MPKHLQLQFLQVKSFLSASSIARETEGKSENFVIFFFSFSSIGCLNEPEFLDAKFQILRNIAIFSLFLSNFPSQPNTIFCLILLDIFH